MTRATPTRAVLLAAWASASACTPPDPSDPSDPPAGSDAPSSPVTDTDVDTTPSTTGDTATSSTTGDTGGTTTTPYVVDCAAIPAAPVSIRTVAGRGYHDVVFDPYGNLIGSDNNSLISTAYDGSWSVFVPGMNIVQGMDWLPDGDMVVAQDSTANLVRITPGGAYSVLATSVGAYGVMVGPDGFVYTANYDAIHRIDPNTGGKQVLIDVPGLEPRVLNFSPDASKMYIGTLAGFNGAIYVVDLDANLDPLGPPTVFATGVGTGAYHDGLGVDACGNLYVPDYSTSALYRVSSTGQVSTLVDYTFTEYTHGLEWGNGTSYWRSDALYLPQPYNGNEVIEIVVGVPSRTYTGSVINY